MKSSVQNLTLAVAVLTKVALTDSCNSLPTPYLLGASDGQTYFSCSAIIDNDLLALGGKSSSSTIHGLAQTWAPLFVLLRLSSDLEIPEKAKYIDTGTQQAQEVSLCSADEDNSHFLYLFLENPSVLFRYDVLSDSAGSWVIKENSSSVAYLNDFTASQMFVNDEVFLQGLYTDSSSNEYYYTSSMLPSIGVSTINYNRHITIAGCNIQEIGPFVPYSASANYMGVSVHECSGTYLTHVHRAHTTSFEDTRSFSHGNLNYPKPELAVIGDNNQELVVFGTMFNNNDARISFYDKTEVTSYYYDVGSGSSPDIRGLYYDTGLEKAHAVYRKSTSDNIYWLIIDDPHYENTPGVEQFTLKNVPSSETLVQSSYYNQNDMWNFVFHGTNLLSETYSSTVAYFYRYSYADKETLNCNENFLGSDSGGGGYTQQTYSGILETSMGYLTLDWVLQEADNFDSNFAVTLLDLEMGDHMSPCTVRPDSSSGSYQAVQTCATDDVITLDAMTIAPSAGCTSEVIVYSYEDCNSGNHITGLTFDELTRTLTCTSSMAVASYQICFKGEIGSTVIWSNTIQFTLTKTELNMAPTWDAAFTDFNIEVFQTLQHSMTGFSDSNPQDNHVLDCINGPSWITVLADSVQSDGTQDASQIGAHTIQCRVTDNDAANGGVGPLSSSYQTLTINVAHCDNNPPVFNTNTADVTLNTSCAGDYFIVYEKAAVDGANSNDIYTYTILYAGSSALPTGISFDQSEIIVDCPNLAIGVYNLEVQVDDNNSCGSPSGIQSTLDTFTLTMTDFNNAPNWVTTLSNQIVYINGGNKQISLTAGMYSDVDVLDTHTWSLINDCLYGASISVSNVLTLVQSTDDLDDRVTCTVTLTLEDSDSATGGTNKKSVTQNFIVEYQLYNFQPSIGSYSSKTSVEVFTGPLTIALPPYSDQNVGDFLHLSVESYPDLPFLTFDSFTKTITVHDSTITTDIGTYTYQFKVTDDNSIGASNGVQSRQWSMDIVIAPCVNEKPDVLTIITDTTLKLADGETRLPFKFTDLNERDSFSYAIKEDINNDGNYPNYVGTVLSIDVVTKELVVHPTSKNDIKDYRLKIIAYDDNTCGAPEGIKQRNFSFILTIDNSVNQQPSWTTSFVNQEINVLEEITIFMPGYTDPDLGDTHTEEVFVEGSASFPSFITYNSGDFSLTIKPTSSDQVGNYDIEAYVTDSDSAQSGVQKTISGAFTLTINNVSCFQGSYTSGSLTVGEMLDFEISDFSTSFCSTATFSFTANGAELPSFLIASGSTVQANPTSNEEAGDYSIEATITHERSSEVISTFTITVLEIETSSDSSSDSGGFSTTTYLGNSGISLNVNFDYQFKEDEEELSVEISRVTQTGEIYLLFSKGMQSVSDLTIFREMNALSLYLISETLDEQYVEEEAIVDWYVQSYEDQYMVIKVLFKDPLFISASQDPDFIEVEINRRIFFVTYLGEMLEIEDLELKEQLPPQISEGDAETIAALGEIINSIFSGPTGLATNLILAFSLQLLWKMLGTVQLIVHTPFMAVSFPSNAKMTFDLIIDLANLKIIPVDYLQEKALGMKLKATQESGGYSNNLIESMGLMFFGLGFILLFGGVLFLMYKAFKKVKFIQKLGLMVYDKLVFNFFLRTFIAGYLVFALGSFKNIEFPSFGSPVEIVSSTIAYVLSAFVIFSPIIGSFFLMKYQNLLARESTRKRIGTLYEGIDTRQKSKILFNMLFIARRMLLAAVIVFCGSFPAFQVQTILWTSMFTVTYSASVWPFQDMSMNYLDIMNESTIMFVAYSTIPYSDYLADPYFKYDIGWLVIGVFFLNLAANVLFILGKTVLKMYKKFKNRKKKGEDRKSEIDSVLHSESLLPLNQDDNKLFVNSKPKKLQNPQDKNKQLKQKKQTIKNALKIQNRKVNQLSEDQLSTFALQHIGQSPPQRISLKKKKRTTNNTDVQPSPEVDNLSMIAAQNDATQFRSQVKKLYKNQRKNFAWLYDK